MNFKKRVLLLTPLLLALVFYCFNYDFYKISCDIYPNKTMVLNRNNTRDVRWYVSEKRKPLILPEEFCVNETLLVVIINGRHRNFESRKAIRETWGRSHEDVSFYFLIGREKEINYEVQSLIEQESKTHGDLIQEDFIDSYNNLTLKSINMLKLFHMHCSKSKYLLKVDDDVYLNVTNLLKSLDRNASDLLWGHLANDSPPLRDPCNKWYVPYEVYPEDSYPPYLCGPTYLMSSDVVTKLYHCALTTPLVHIEDVFITGICSKKVGLTVKDNAKIVCLSIYNRYICKYRDFHALHNFNPEELRRSFGILQEGRCWAQGSILEWLYSLYYG